MNHQLSGERAKTIMNILSEFRVDSTESCVNTRENFDAFYRDMKELNRTSFLNLDSLALKDTINSNQALRESLEPILATHRYGTCKLFTTWLEPVEYSVGMVKQQMEAAMAQNKIQLAKRWQTALHQYAYDGTIDYESTLSVPIPRTKQYMPLLNNRLMLKYKLDSNNSDLKREIMMQLDTLHALSPKNRSIATNLAILVFEEQAKFIQMKNKREVLDILKVIEDISGVQTQVKKRLKLNACLYHISASFQLELPVPSGKWSELKRLSSKPGLSEDDRYQIAKLFAHDTRYKEALALMKKVRNKNVDHYRFLTKLYVLFTSEDNLKEMNRMLLEFSSVYPKAFCDSFNSPRVNFQSFDAENLKMIYCETCKK